jgi:hypothetical protein
MKPLFLALFMMLIAFSITAQIRFEPGYFITNTGEKVNCLIKNSDWQNNPTSFKYQLTKESKIEDGDILNIKEFGVITKINMYGQK